MPTPDLIGLHELAALLGISKQHADYIRRRDDFPAPLAKLKSGSVWDAEQVKKWAALHRPKSKRRPTV